MHNKHIKIRYENLVNMVTNSQIIYLWFLLLVMSSEVAIVNQF